MNNSAIIVLQNAKYKCDVPVLTREQIETIAEEIHGISGNRVIPVDIENVMEKEYDLTLDYQILRPDGGILGETIFYPCCRTVFHTDESVVMEQIRVREGTILIDESLSEMEARYRFTLAHELGHWVLHQKFYKTTTDCACRQYRSQPLINSHHQARTPIEWTELQANTFAGAFLMPRSAMRASLKKYLIDNDLSWQELSNFSNNRSREYYTAFLDGVAKTFVVSKEAARIRMNKLCRFNFPH